MSSLTVTFPVCDSHSYRVGFYKNFHNITGTIAGRYRGVPLFLVCDRKVHSLYGKRMTSDLIAAGAFLRTFVLPSGERQKSPGTKARLDDRLIRAGVTRDSVLIALGGGVIGDLAGFSAATILRGIRLVQVPTTLLSQVDSSVGGKVGIDHPLGKNLIGSFYQPDAVYISPSTLLTLDRKEFMSGLGEVIKYAMILDPKLFRQLERQRGEIQRRRVLIMEKIIRRCVRLKANVVSADERESGSRRILNFGHTIGHAVEHLSAYRIPHGHAVAIGMCVEAELSVKMGFLKQKDLERLRIVIGGYGLPTSIPSTISHRSIIRAISFDKKKRRGKVRFTLLSGIGRARVGVIVPASLLSGVLTR